MSTPLLQQALIPKEQYDWCKPHFLVYSHTHYSEQQRKLSEVLYWYARQNLHISPHHKEFIISRSQLKTLAHIKATNYEQMKKALDELQEISIKTNITAADGSELRTSIVPFYSIASLKKSQNGTIYIRFKIAEEVLQGILKSSKHSSFLSNILLIPHLKGVCHPIYHVLRYEKDVHQHTQTTIPIAIYRQLIGLQDQQYTRFRDLKRKKIQPLKELVTNPHIDIEALEISYLFKEEKKKPSNPTHIVIRHQRKRTQERSELEEKAISKLMLYQFDLAEILPYLQNPKMGAHYVLEKVVGIEQQYQGKKHLVQSRKGLLKKAIEQDYKVTLKKDYHHLQRQMEQLKQEEEITHQKITQEVKSYLHHQSETHQRQIRQDYIDFLMAQFGKHSTQLHNFQKQAQNLQQLAGGGRLTRFIYLSYLAEKKNQWQQG